jgi:hypothetical protein
MDRLKDQPEVKRFISFVKDECKKYGIRCTLKRSKYLVLSDSGMKCSGYFDDYDRELAVAMNGDLWLGVLVHEYSHLTQWIDNPKVWIDIEKYNSGTKVDDWLHGKAVRNPEFHIDIVKNLELDNEKRTVALIKEHGLDKHIDIPQYIKRANAYVQFHNWMKHSRSWYKIPNTPYSNTYITDRMPTKFNMNYDKMSKEVYQIFLKSGI